jgi:hypothetical protein
MWLPILFGIAGVVLGTVLGSRVLARIPEVACRLSCSPRSAARWSRVPSWTDALDGDDWVTVAETPHQPWPTQ